MFVRLALKVFIQNGGDFVDENHLHVPYFKKLTLC